MVNSVLDGHKASVTRAFNEYKDAPNERAAAKIVQRIESGLKKGFTREEILQTHTLPPEVAKLLDPSQARDDKESPKVENLKAPMGLATAPLTPKNLILYGPPGTGKTYATAERAVQICDGKLPSSRAATMARYRELVARRRVALVTFHQSYSYEDFVEGLRPDSGDGEGESGRGGFSLQPRPGIFLQIAGLAHANRGQANSLPNINRQRQVFKMSLGRSAEDEDSQLFSNSIEGGYVVLGWGGEIDWSAQKYDNFAAIKARWQEDHPDTTGHDPNVQQLYALRAGMGDGDFVIVSDGNKKFRAIGEIIGPYQYVPGYLREYNHRRALLIPLTQAASKMGATDVVVAVEGA
jgi:5-methylcytosine-specific restriction enzyme B